MWNYQPPPSSEELFHFGVKGMKWGRRRSDSSAPPKPKPKPLSEMSDEELRAKLNRLNMEKQYKQYLSEMNPKKESMAKRVALRILENGITTLGNKAFERIGQNLLAKSAEKEPPMSELLKKDRTKLSTKEMQRLNTHFAAQKTLQTNFRELDAETLRRSKRWIMEDGTGI